MRTRRRILLSILIGLLAGAVSLAMPKTVVVNGIQIGDIGVPLFGLKNFLHGIFTYEQYYFENAPATTYPFTTMLALYPFLYVPLSLIAPLFCSLITTVFVYAILHDGKPWRLLILLSAQYITALQSVQFSPLIFSALLIPWLLPLAIIKPQLGIVLIASGKWSLPTILATMLMLVISLIVYPAWPIDWLEHGNFSSYAGKIPVFQGVGFVLLLSCIKWRNRRARLLTAMSLIPQRLWYDQLMLFLIPETRYQLYILLIGSWISLFLGEMGGSAMQSPLSWTIVNYFLYLPALCLIFREELIKGMKIAKEQFSRRTIK